jgi:hypothetical protein
LDVAIRPAARARAGAAFVAAIYAGFTLVVLSDHGSSQVHRQNPTSSLMPFSPLLMR